MKNLGMWHPCWNSCARFQCIWFSDVLRCSQVSSEDGSGGPDSADMISETLPRCMLLIQPGSDKVVTVGFSQGTRILAPVLSTWTGLVTQLPLHVPVVQVPGSW